MAVDELLTVAQAASVLGIRPWTLRHWISAQKIEVVKYGNGSVRLKRSVLDRLVARSTIKAREPNARTGAKQSRFLQGSSVGPTTGRWLVEIRYPDGTRRRRRLRREREALPMWSPEHNKIETGAWNRSASTHVTLENALKDYRAYSKVQHRSHAGYVECALRLWERNLDVRAWLAKISTSQIEAVKLRRAQQVSRSTVDKDLAVLKAFFNWCIGRGLAVSNPVRPVKLFREDNSRLRYLTLEEYDRLLLAARTVKTSPYLEEKIVLAAHTGLRRGSLFKPALGSRGPREPGHASPPHKKWTHLVAAPECDRTRNPPEIAGGAFPRFGVGICFPPHCGSSRGKASQGHQERLPRGHGARRDRRFHLARSAAHVRLLARHEGRVLAQRRRAARTSVREDDAALRPPIAGVSVGRGEPPRSRRRAEERGLAARRHQSGARSTAESCGRWKTAKGEKRAN